MVMANEIIDPEVQYNAASPEGMSWLTPIDLTTVPSNIKAKFDALPIDPSRVSTEELNSKKLPELQSDWLMRIEEDWQANVLRQ